METMPKGTMSLFHMSTVKRYGHILMGISAMMLFWSTFIYAFTLYKSPASHTERIILPILFGGLEAFIMIIYWRAINQWTSMIETIQYSEWEQIEKSSCL